MHSWGSWCDLLEGRRLPAAMVDMDAVARNVAVLLTARGDRSVPLRIATKSIRHLGVIRRILALGGPAIQGVMAYQAAELPFLAAHGFQDLLLAYPIARAVDAEAVAAAAKAGATCRVVIDAVQQATLLSEAATRAGVTIGLCVEVDMAWRPGLGLHLGVRRSPIRTPEAALALARAVRALPGVVVNAVMGYEAQIAGMQDHNRGSRLFDPIRGLVKAGSRTGVGRRAEVVEALTRDGFDIEVVNGGGSGSVAFTAADPSVTEVAAGSGFLCSHLFDGYHGLPIEPAIFFAIAVVRVPAPGFVTCAGGGYLASGPAAADRAPRLHLPEGLALVSTEGFGEVQTPLRDPAERLAPGDPVICRHAKAGELAERFSHYLIIEGDRVTEEPTYRGLGGCFP